MPIMVYRRDFYIQPGRIGFWQEAEHELQKIQSLLQGYLTEYDQIVF